MTKVTNAMILEAIKLMAEELGENPIQIDDEVEVTGADIASYVDRTIASMENKKTKAQQKAAEKKNETDSLGTVVLQLMSDAEFEPIDTIVGRVQAAVPEATRSKVISRLTNLCEKGIAEKGTIKVDSRKISGYKLIPVPVDGDAE